MNVIWKYELRPTADQRIEIRMPGTIVSTAVVGGWIVVYALINPDTLLPIKRRMFIVPTGGEVPAEAMRFVGTVVQRQHDTDFVFHIWTDHQLT